MWLTLKSFNGSDNSLHSSKRVQVFNSKIHSTIIIWGHGKEGSHCSFISGYPRIIHTSSCKDIHVILILTEYQIKEDWPAPRMTQCFFSSCRTFVSCSQSMIHLRIICSILSWTFPLFMMIFNKTTVRDDEDTDSQVRVRNSVPKLRAWLHKGSKRIIYWNFVWCRT